MKDEKLHEKPMYRRDCLKSWGLDSRFKGGGCLYKKEARDVFDGGWG